MVEPGDTVSGTLKKEFGEEAMNSLEASPEEKKRIEEQISKLFSHGEQVRKGSFSIFKIKVLNVKVSDRVTLIYILCITQGT